MLVMWQQKQKQKQNCHCVLLSPAKYQTRRIMQQIFRKKLASVEQVLIWGSFCFSHFLQALQRPQQQRLQQLEVDAHVLLCVVQGLLSTRWEK